MDGAIASNAQTASELATTIKNSLSGYLGFSLSTIAGDVPVSASGVHDDGLAPEITRALNDWENLITADAKAIEDIAGEISSLDSDLVYGLMGLGSGQ